MTASIAVELRITGRVQGVCYRDHTRRQADRLGLLGWVRNEPDGSVRAHVEGDPDAVEELVDWCHHGPDLANVDRVERTPREPIGHFPNFQITF